jgi:hypothetical protein
MKLRSTRQVEGSQRQTTSKRTPRRGRVRALGPERPTRLYSLLLPPTFPTDRK